jgi:hypothetical protein
LSQPPAEETSKNGQGDVDLQIFNHAQTDSAWPLVATDGDPLSRSALGEDWTGLGCFHLGLEATGDSFAEILQAQRNLKVLDLLQCVEQEELQIIAKQIRLLYDAKCTSDNTPVWAAAVRDLLDLFTANPDDGNPRIQVYVGLHSGFQTSGAVQFWGLYGVDPSSGVFTVFLSGKTPDRASTILHTFLSSRRLSRTECFMAELAMAEHHGALSEKWSLPSRIVHDVEQLSPMEMIIFMRRLGLLERTHDSSLMERLRACCKYQLMEVPTLSQIRAMNSTTYLSGKITPENLVASRLAWLGEKGCWHPDLSASLSLFEEVDTRLYEVLMSGQSDVLAQLGVVIQTITQKNRIDASADIFSLAVFCAFRKLALDEIYLEVLDRNPYPNTTTDQAACFAENFAVGSRCDSFFDMTPKALGRVISDRCMAHYKNHQPPPREEGFTELPTAYAAMQIDADPQDGKEAVPIYYQFTFLAIFALPALIDIMLLTTVGRGLYLTTFMSSTQKTLATTALMLALLVCGAVGSWITSGGTYYLYASGFPAMNMFVLTRFIAGIAIALVGGLGGMVAVIIVNGATAGLIFFYYFAMLTTYLLTLSVLSVYQLPGSSFQSVSISQQCLTLVSFPISSSVRYMITN